MTDLAFVPRDRIVSLEVIMEYLTHSSVSPLPSVFVEVADPLASDVSVPSLSYLSTGL